MKKILLFIFPFLILSSCAQINSENDDIYEMYNMYILSLKNNKSDISFDMLSTRNKNDLISNSKKEIFTDYFPIISSLDTVLTKEINNYHSIDAEKSCLTITGYDQSNELTSINLEYLNESGQWKLDYAQIMYHESAKELLTDATCPLRI